MKLTAIIVDDEAHARENLRMLLEEFCPEIEVVGAAHSVESAKKLIDEKSPQVVFLDIRMPSGAEGFELLEQVPGKKFQVVFVTAFKEYAVKAFQANAVHYILKPIDIEDLQAAVQKLLEYHHRFEDDPKEFSDYLQKLEKLSSQFGSSGNRKIAISHSKGIKIVESKDITYLEASGNCTKIHFADSASFLDTRTLKVYEDLLTGQAFFRVHKSYMINLDFLQEYRTDEGNFAVLKGGVKLPVARNRVGKFTELIKNRMT